MKKIISLLVASVLLLCGCTPSAQPNQTPPTSQTDETSVPVHPELNTVFTWNEEGNLVSESGNEYVRLSYEGTDTLRYIGVPQFAGPIQGEPETDHILTSIVTLGMRSFKESDSILMRIDPDSEWYSLYRKASLPEYDFSLENCDRIEFTPIPEIPVNHTQHITCGGGITDKDEIKLFISELKSQLTPDEAGLYDLVRQPDGAFENCYLCAFIYGYFENEPNLVQCMWVKSYNDQAYSVMLGNDEYVLPTQWVQWLQAGCSEK